MAVDDRLFNGIGAASEQQRRDRFDLVAASEIAQRGIVPVAWDFEGLIEESNGPVLLTAAPERYKSWFAMLACYSSVTGRALFGHFAVRKKRPWAIYLNLDAGKSATENRVARLGTDLPANFLITTWYHWDAKRFADLLEEHPGAFVVVDCFANIHQPGEKRTDPGEALRIVLQDLRVIYERNGCNGIVIDHAARVEREDGENFSGSQQKKAATRAGITMQRAKLDRDEDEPTDRTVIHFGCLKMSEAEQFPPFEIEFSFPEGLLTTRFLGGCVNRTARQSERDVAAIEYVLRGGESLSGSEIIAASHVARDRAYEVLRGPKFERSGSARSTRYKLAQEDATDEEGGTFEKRL